MWKRARPTDRTAMASRLWIVVAPLAFAATGCVTTPPFAPPAPVPEPVAIAVPAREPTCLPCAEQTREIERLRQELASREAELRELRSSQRYQIKVIQESKREVTRAKAKLRRLATQADAASYIAEVEVAMASLRKSLGAKSNLPPSVDAAKRLLDSTAAPFAQGEYGVAMDRAAQAEQLIASAADDQARLRTARRNERARPPEARISPEAFSAQGGPISAQVALQSGIALKVTADSRLRRQPLAKARDVGVLKKNSPVIARARKGGWMQVETEDGRWGWIDRTVLAAR